jgi:superfamily II DNA/RNA helicase
MSFESTGLSESAFEDFHAPGNETPASSLTSIPPAPETSTPEMPQSVDVGRGDNPPKMVAHHFYSIAKERKLDLLVHAIRTENMEGVLVFSHTKHGADMIARRLAQRGIPAVAVHADRSRGQRERALESFKRRNTRVLVATDIAVRGIEVTGISHVVNFEVPVSADDYTRRIHGTGWASATGSVLTFVSHDEDGRLHKIQKFTGQRQTPHPYPGLPAAKGIDTVSNERPGSSGHAFSIGKPRVSGHVFSNERPKSPGHTYSTGKPRVSGHMSSNERPKSPGHAYSIGKPRVSGHVPSNERPKSSGHPFSKPKARPFGKPPGPPRKKKGPIMTARKKKPARKMESFSSFMGDPRYS